MGFYHQMVGFPVNPKNHLQCSVWGVKKAGLATTESPKRCGKVCNQDVVEEFSSTSRFSTVQSIWGLPWCHVSTWKAWLRIPETSILTRGLPPLHSLPHPGSRTEQSESKNRIRMVFPKMGGPNHPKICGFLLKPIKKNGVRQCWERHRQCMVDTTQIDIFTQIIGVEYTRSMWWRDPTSCMKWLDLPADCEWHQLLLWTFEVCLRQL